MPCGNLYTEKRLKLAVISMLFVEQGHLVKFLLDQELVRSWHSSAVLDGPYRKLCTFLGVAKFRDKPVRLPRGLWLSAAAVLRGVAAAVLRWDRRSRDTAAGICTNTTFTGRQPGTEDQSRFLLSLFLFFPFVFINVT